MVYLLLSETFNDFCIQFINCSVYCHSLHNDVMHFVQHLYRLSSNFRPMAYDIYSGIIKKLTPVAGITDVMLILSA